MFLYPFQIGIKLSTRNLSYKQGSKKLIIDVYTLPFGYEQGFE